MFDLPTHPDGNFYSIPETNQIIEEISKEIEENSNEIREINENKYKIVTKEIAENTDLNTLTEGGFYSSRNTNVTATLTNVPTGLTSGFVLVVIKYAGDATGLEQIIVVGKLIFTRHKGSGDFADWYKTEGIVV